MMASYIADAVLQAPSFKSLLRDGPFTVLDAKSAGELWDERLGAGEVERINRELVSIPTQPPWDRTIAVFQPKGWLGVSIWTREGTPAGGEGSYFHVLVVGKSRGGSGVAVADGGSVGVLFGRDGICTSMAYVPLFTDDKGHALLRGSAGFMSCPIGENGSLGVPQEWSVNNPMHRASVSMVHMALFSFALAHCSNVPRRTVHPTRQIQRARRREGKPPLLQYEVLDLRGFRAAVEEVRSSQPGMTRREACLHVVRAHPMRTRSGRTVLRREHYRGNPLRGFKAKDYRILPQREEGSA